MTSYRVLTAGFLLATTAAAALTTTPAVAQQTEGAKTFSIPNQPLPTALLAFADQSGLTLVYDARIARGGRSPGVSGRLPVDAALNELLSGSGLSYRFTSAESVTISQSVASPDDGPETLNQLIVTARRFEEGLEEVPGSVAVLSDEEIQRSNIDDLNDYVLRIPNTNFVEGGSPTDAELSIRGISNLIGGSATGPTSGVYIDEVIINPTGSNLGLNPTLFDLERLEVAFGPQGTTFGRGTIGGAVNFVTKKPSADFEANVEVEAGSFPDGRVRGVINGAILDEDLLNGRLTFFGQAADGFIDTPNVSDPDALDTSDFGARLALRSQPIDRLTLDWSGSLERNNFVQGNVATEDSIAGGDDLIFLFNEEEAEGDVNRFLTNFRAEYDTGFGTAISNTSFLIVKSDTILDGDFSAADIFLGTADDEDRSIAQEFRFNSDGFDLPFAGETSFILGANFSFNSTDTEFAITGQSDLASVVGPGAGALVNSTELDVFNFGVFGDVTFRPIDRLELGAGARFNLDRVEIDVKENAAIGTFAPLFGPTLGDPFSAKETFTGVTPKGSIRYEWTDDFSTYVAISTGFRSGGFNTLPTVFGTSFGEESAINYEGGFRSSWFDNRLVVNGSGFALFYDDIQVSALTPIASPLAPGGTVDVPAIVNAAEARSIGAEITVQARPIDGLFLGIDYGLAKSNFIDFIEPSVGDLTGSQLPNAPVHTLSVIAEYEHPVANDFGDAFMRWEYNYTSDFFNSITDVAPGGDTFGDRNVVNLRIGLRADRFEVEAFAENLFNEFYQTGETSDIATTLFGLPQSGEVGPTRRFGVRGKIFF
ncbi:MAG: TonB-dependent receptor [Pseudomonadota bacterium]